MNANRAKTIKGVKVEEFYWNGRLVVYIDNHKTDESFDSAVKRLEQE
ncbi:MAG: hypothetical protein OQK29_01270 [Ignavibacteriaceae bacterium]|nr:hypothetical protein [Ignavibacteriaceae bacterium]